MSLLQFQLFPRCHQGPWQARQWLCAPIELDWYMVLVQKMVRTISMIRNNCQSDSMGTSSFGWRRNNTPEFVFKKGKLANLEPSAMIARWNRVEHFLLGEHRLSPLVALQPAVLPVHLEVHRIDFQPSLSLQLHLSTEVTNIIVTWESSYKLESSSQRHLQFV